MYDNYAKIRDSKGLKDYNVAKETGISTGTLGDWKAGNYTPKIDKLQKIADFLGVSVEYLLTGSTPEKSYNYDITEFEYQIILAFRKEKAMQDSVLRLLGIEKNVESMSLEQAG